MPTPVIDGQDVAAIQAAKTGVAVYDRSTWGCISISGEDRIRFLHNQTTNDFHNLKPGQGCDTVILTSTARTIDLVTSYILEDAVLLLVSPNRCEMLMQWFDRYIFLADQVQLTDITASTASFNLIGLGSDAIVEKLGAIAIIGQPYGYHQTLPFFRDRQEQKMGLIVAVGNGLTANGYTLIFPRTEIANLWEKILELGALPLSDRAWEILRILQGRPAPDFELTDDYNPLEVGLWQAISFNKGCYIGQETIARLNTYKGVKQHLWGIRLNAPAEIASTITVGTEKVGKLTSYTATPEGHFGLGYIRSKVGGVGLKVYVGETEGEVVAVPFVSHEYP